MSSPSTAPAPPKFKLSLGSKKSAQSAASSKPLKRPHTSLLGNEEQGDENDEHGVASAEIISLGAGKATTTAPTTTAPQRVIAPIPNRDWREEATKRKRQRSKLPGQEHAENLEIKGSRDVIKDDGQDAGLQIPAQTSKRTSSRPEQTSGDEAGQQQTNGEAAEQPQTTTAEDDEAFAALTGIRPNNVNTHRIIRQDSPPAAPITDEDAFRHDFHSAPEAPTLNQYAATPIDGFGLALLRGYDPNVKMSEEEDQKVPPHKKQIIQPRKDLLGLGAKDMDLQDPTNANGKKLSQREKAMEDRKRRNAKKEILDYNPLARKNTKTGEIIDDEALKIKVEEQKKADEEDSTSASKKLEDRHSDNRKDRTRDRRRRDDYSTDSEGHRRERDRQKRKEKERRRDRYDDDRERDSRRERGHRKDREDDSDYDRERRRERHRRKGRDESEHGGERRGYKASRRDDERDYDHRSSRGDHRRDRDREDGRRH